jgi:hypothetical protein
MIFTRAHFVNVRSYATFRSRSRSSSSGTPRTSSPSPERSGRSTASRVGPRALSNRRDRRLSLSPWVFCPAELLRKDLCQNSPRSTVTFVVRSLYLLIYAAANAVKWGYGCGPWPCSAAVVARAVPPRFCHPSQITSPATAPSAARAATALALFYDTEDLAFTTGSDLSD